MEAAPRSRLAAILHADVAGSTALVRRHERVAHERISGAFRRLAAVVAAYGGAAHEVRGDALVAEFERASDAVCAALAFQEQNAAYNEQLADDIRPVVRIGIAMGEVVVAGGTVTGAGVVLAQRLEQLAKNGGVVIQGAAQETVARRLPIAYTSLGEHDLKGFDEPVRAFAVSLRPSEVVPPPEVDPPAGRSPTRRRWWLAAAVIATLATIALGWWQPWKPAITRASVEQMELELPKQPSIAVLPFANLTGDAGQDHISDGITEDIISTLARLPDLFVIARNSSYAFKNSEVTTARVAEQLGVRYLLDGSVQRSGSRLRVTVQLIDAIRGQSLWSERYDRELDDLFALQDEITRRIAVSLQVELTEGEQAQRRARSTENLDAWMLSEQAKASARRHTPEDVARAIELYREALALDPGYAEAWRGLGAALFVPVRTGWSEDPKADFAQALEAAERSLELDPEKADALAFVGMLHLYRREHDRAIELGNRAITVGPNMADSMNLVADIMRYSGQFAEAIALVKKAMRLNPRYSDYYLYVRGVAEHHEGLYDDAVTTLEKLVERNPTYPWAHAFLADSYAHLGDAERAARHVRRELEVNPGFSLDWALARAPYRDREFSRRNLEHMESIGLPR